MSVHPRHAKLKFNRWSCSTAQISPLNFDVTSRWNEASRFTANCNIGFVGAKRATTPPNCNVQRPTTTRWTTMLVDPRGAKLKFNRWSCSTAQMSPLNFDVTSRWNETSHYTANCNVGWPTTSRSTVTLDSPRLAELNFTPRSCSKAPMSNDEWILFTRQRWMVSENSLFWGRRSKNTRQITCKSEKKSETDQ